MKIIECLNDKISEELSDSESMLISPLSIRKAIKRQRSFSMIFLWKKPNITTNSMIVSLH